MVTTEGFNEVLKVVMLAVSGFLAGYILGKERKEKKEKDGR